MSPIRILILAVLFYLLYRLLVGRRAVDKPAADRAAGSSSAAVDDTLVEDPVCHTYIPLKESETLRLGEITHHFCSKECRRKFQATQKSD